MGVDIISVAEVAQAAGANVALVTGLTPSHPAAAVCAPALVCRCAPADNLALHAALFGARPGTVLVCDAGGRRDGGYFGELMARDAVNRSLAGLVIDGAVRDLREFEGLGFPVFHRGTCPRSCAKAHAPTPDHSISLAGVEVRNGDQVVADRDGVAVVPADRWPAIRQRALAIREREDAIRLDLEHGHRLATVLGITPQVRGTPDDDRP